MFDEPPAQDFDPPREGRAKAAASPKVLIIAMPFSTPEFPGLGPTLIRSILLQAGIATDIFYGNLLFSKIIGADAFVENALSELPICELAFTPYYFGTDVAEAADELRQYVLELAVVPEKHTEERFLEIVRNAGRCLDQMMEAIDWSQYDIVGFSLLMGQTVASLALAKRIKAAHPHITIIMGGAHTQAPMGDEMVRAFPEIDFVLQGEADDIVAAFVREHRAGERTDFSAGGILFRGAAGDVRSTGPAKPFTRLDSLPVPDFSQFFAQMRLHGLTHIQPYLPLETSRGCWWGEKHHCSFCGIDDVIMVFRSKSPERVVREIVTLSAENQYTEFFTVDSIINFKFFNSLLPDLGELRRDREWDFTFFFESKSNISRDQTRRFRYGGVNHVQPGLESFSDHVLKLMNKGTTGARQVQCLKLLAEYNIMADWNLIYCNPGETDTDYREIVDLIPFIHHLPPLHAGGLIPMQINRYAPYFNEPERHGIRNIRPKRYYEKIYPGDRVNLDRLAFYFDCDFVHAQPDSVQAGHRELDDALATWRACFVPGSLIQRRGPGFVQITDKRSWVPELPVRKGSERVFTLCGIAAEIFAYCSDIRTVDDVVRTFEDRCSPGETIAFLDRLFELKLLYRSPAMQIIALPLLMEAQEAFRFVPGGGDRTLNAARGDPAPAARRQVDRLISSDAESGLLVIDRPAGQQGESDSIPLEQMRSATGLPEARQRIALAPDVAPETVIEAIRRDARELTCLSFDLQGLDPGNGRHIALLDALAVWRSEELLGFDLSCELTRALTAEQAGQLRVAGVGSVRIGRIGAAEAAATANLLRLQAAKNLAAHDIEVSWQLDPRTSLAGGEAGATRAMCASALHVPAPASPDASPDLAELVGDWARNHEYRSLTYARGPGFMRLFDRRAALDRWRFITLDENQASVMLACETVKGFEDLRAALPSLGAQALRRFLDALIDLQVICADGRDHYLALPIRRSIEERWASGDH